MDARDLVERVARLSAPRREALAARLRERGALPPAEPAADRRLVAYVEPLPGRGVTAGELRAHLRERLPEPMVPAAFVVLPSFPRTPTGKVDRRALPAPEDERPERARTASASASPEEAALADLWAEVLGLDEVGLDDDFFELGGDSILLLKLCARARELGLALAPRDLFAHPTISGLAAATSGTAPPPGAG